MTNLQKKALKRSHDLVSEIIARLFDLEKSKPDYTSSPVWTEFEKIKWKLVEIENWIGALLDEK